MQAAAYFGGGCAAGGGLSSKGRVSAGSYAICEKVLEHRPALLMPARRLCFGGSQIGSIEMGLTRMRTGMRNILRPTGKGGSIHAHASGPFSTYI